MYKLNTDNRKGTRTSSYVEHKICKEKFKSTEDKGEKNMTTSIQICKRLVNKEEISSFPMSIGGI